MKWSHDRGVRVAYASAGAVLATCLCAGAVRPVWHGMPLLFTPGHGVARWIENVEAGSEVEKSLYRLMQLPGGEILFRRSPRETVPALTALQQTQKTAALYSLRALEEEQGLDFGAAERDWKTWAEQSEDRTGAHLDLADFYERRLQPQQELAALEAVGQSAPEARERWTAPEEQRAWLAWDRALKVVSEYALPRSAQAHIYEGWIKRYPDQPSLYARQFAFLLDGREFAAAQDAIARYRAAFPSDRIFPVKAEADLAARRGQAKDGLAIYEARFEPLWPAELVKSYFDLVLQSHSQRALSDSLRAKLAANPDGLKDAARLFYLYQQQGQLDSAKAVLSHYREQKETRGARWSAEELDTLEKLFEAIQDFPEAARYAYALASDRTAETSERKGVVALARILLTAPEQPLRVGAGNLALYKNIATMDRGPGYLNGILSLLLNTQGPQSEFANEEQAAVPYFHRARAAELLSQIDRRFPGEPSRAQLHASLMEAYAVYGENGAVIREGTAILAQFPHFDGRIAVALNLADAYARTRQIDKEFAVYQDLLKELAAQAEGVPLGAGGTAYSKPVASRPPGSLAPANDNNAVEDNGASAAGSGIRSRQYAQVLDRYLARLVALQRLPEALEVLRGELDRNPQDPGLYEKLATFLEQNSLNAHEEEVYQRAIQQFQDTGWYAKLARLYLRQRRNADYTGLMHKVAGIFSGTELETFLEQAPAPNASLAIQVNQYANQRFPHDLRFAESLIGEYRSHRRWAELEKLLWEYWPESPQLRNELFELLSSTGRLDAELSVLQQETPEIEKADWKGLAERNPAAERFWLEACLWQSHFEQGAGAADALAAAYPADSTLGEQASSLYRSLAYFDPADTDKAAAIQKRLLDANPGNLDTLARIGDIYADRGRFSEAAPYFARMAEVHPGEADGYLQSATVFWDYFDFSSAQEQLHKARERLNDPTLFGYQAGAIEESRGNISAAVSEYAASASAEKPSSESRDRLLALARRPALQPEVEAATSGLLKQAAPSLAGIQLRAGVLEAEHRKADLDRELKQAIAQTSSFDVLDAIAGTARSHELGEAEEAAMRRQIALTADPVRSLQLRYQLVDFLQAKGSPAAAQEADAIYREHGKILGVVRSTVDYNWGHGRKPQAVQVLLESAQAAYPELKSSFELEAARKLTDLGDYARSRSLLSALLSRQPLNAAYESAMADNLARANDEQALVAFYRAQLDLVKKANLDRGEKAQRIGQLRRGMIGAATLLGNYNEATDQYIELIDAYPDDADLTQEAALFAVAHGAAGRLSGFYQKTIADSPRDPRWSIVLARIATAAEDDPLAIDAYGKALRLRPERQDLYIAQAALEEHMHRLDDAIALYRRLYTLSYRDPRWMEKVAELCARQGRGAEAVKALEAGWIEGRPAKAANSFEVAARLEKWGLLDEARTFADRGVEQAGADLLISVQAGAATYARILTRQRQSAAAYARLLQARQHAPDTTAAAFAEQVVKQGPGAITNEEWRRQRAQEQSRQATLGFAQALEAMGRAAAEFYTPEEKTQFAGWIRQNAAAAGEQETRTVYLPTVKAAGLTELTAELTWNLIQGDTRLRGSDLADWARLQRQRVQPELAASKLEKLAPQVIARERGRVWREAAAAYRDAGDTVGELRVLQQLGESEALGGEVLTRYFRLVLAQRPQDLIHLAQGEDRAAQYLVRYGSADQALAAVAARSAGRPPVWKNAYTALTGLYLRDHRPDVNTAFASALNADASIGDRIGHPADRSQQLAGDVWFYYASRYGEYLDDGKDPRAEDYLESDLEHTPGNPDAYLLLADYSADTGRTEASLAGYRHSLDLKRDQPAVLDSIANLEWKQGRHPEALAAWSEAVKLLAEEIDARRVPETFWSGFTRVIGNIAGHGQYDSVRQQVESMLRTYIARNGEYRVEPLLEAGYHANHDSVDWLLAITAGAGDQQAVLNSLLPNQWSSQRGWIQKGQRSRIQERILELAERIPQQGERDDRVNFARQRYVEALVEEKKFAQARAILAQVPESRLMEPQWLPLYLAAAEADGSLEQIAARWKKQPDSAPASESLRNAAASLGGKARRTVLRFTYERDLDRRQLTAANFLGLAAIDLDENDTAAAIVLLKRMVLVSGDIYADTDSAAALLEQRSKTAEALPFLHQLVESSPWNAGYKVRLAKAMLAINPQQAEALEMLNAVAGDPRAAYHERAAAATTLKGHGAPASGSEELKLLAQSGCPAAESASKPFFVEARVAAAACATASKAKERLLREALGVDPENPEIRLQYVWSAFAASVDSRALVAARPYLQFGNYYGPVYAERMADQFGEQPSFVSLKPEETIRLIQLVLGVYERRRDFASASNLLPAALRIVQDPARRKALEEKKSHIDDELARLQENDERAPNVRAELDQDRVVRPRLLPGMSVRHPQAAKEVQE